ncbi:hypothetical protein FHN55_16710 [Streptomyces sp. NP160]|uniref:hypothetical protein n=1 Tax=Streptomyces sp. NP160 TaxID=2586637 RepID=UPI00111B7865|nr:hypothetical protein [Streptomyces sp. NP160]TNM61950.1 hypothetical protein FHN55_16710 [Streptomyces sp. NP160]
MAIAQTIPLPARDDQPRQARRGKAAFAAVVLSLTATGLVVAYGQHSASGAAASTTSSASWSRLGLQLGLTALGLALLVTGVVVIVRSGYWRASARGPLSALDRPERRLVMRQLRGQQPVDTADQPHMLVLLAVAAGLRRPWGYLLLVCGMVTNVAAQAVGAARPPALVWVWVLCLVLFAAASVRLLHDKKVAERFLDRYLWSAGGGADLVRPGR